MLQDPNILITNFCWCYNPPSNDKIWGSFVKFSGNQPQHFVFWGKRNAKGQQKINILPQTESQVDKKFRSKVEKTNNVDKLYQDMCVDLKTQITMFTRNLPAWGWDLYNRNNAIFHGYELIRNYVNLTTASKNSKEYNISALYHRVIEQSANKCLPTEEEKQKVCKDLFDLYQTNLNKINELYAGFEDEVLNELLIYTLEN